MKNGMCCLSLNAKMGRVMALAIAVSLLMLAASVPADAQATTDLYQLSAFDHNLNTVNADQWVRIINPGVGGESLCADIYVFNDAQEMIECCACPISANGLLTLSLKQDLTAKPLTGITPDRGVLKILSSSSCDPKDPFPIPNLRAWIAHYETVGKGNYEAYSDTRFDRSDLSAPEQNYLGQACAFVQYLGSGIFGTCQCPANP